MMVICRIGVNFASKVRNAGCSALTLPQNTFNNSCEHSISKIIIIFHIFQKKRSISPLFKVK